MIAGTIQHKLFQTINYIRPVPDRAATGLTADVYQQMRTDFTLAPVITLHSPLPTVMAGVWSVVRESELAGSVSRAYKEAIAAVIAKTNECSYCIDVHTLMLHTLTDHVIAEAIAQGDYDRIQDPYLRLLLQWIVKQSRNIQGMPPVLAASDIPEIIGVAMAYQYINRMAHLFLGETLLPLPTVAQQMTRRLFAATAGKRMVRRLTPGLSLQFLPQTDLPNDLAWAASNPAVAGAFSGFVAVVEDAGRWALPEEVRGFIKQRMQMWQGGPVGISRRWVEDEVVKVQAEHRHAARLALLTALAAYQVDASMIDEFRSQYTEDAQLIAVTAWASLTAARRVGEWFAAPFMRLPVSQ